MFTNAGGYDFEKEKALELLVPGKTYTVNHTDVFDSYTNVYLQEVPGHRFNSVQFEDEPISMNCDFCGRPIIVISMEADDCVYLHLRVNDDLKCDKVPRPAQLQSAPDTITVRFQSCVSGLWYRNPNAAGDISAIKINGRIFTTVPQLQFDETGEAIEVEVS